MKIEWNKVTWYSKLGALILFLLIIPILTFYIGVQYERTVEQIQMAQNQTNNYTSQSHISGTNVIKNVRTRQ